MLSPIPANAETSSKQIRNKSNQGCPGSIILALSTMHTSHTPMMSHHRSTWAVVIPTLCLKLRYNVPRLIAAYLKVFNSMRPVRRQDGIISYLRCQPRYFPILSPLVVASERPGSSSLPITLVSNTPRDLSSYLFRKSHESIRS